MTQIEFASAIIELARKHPISVTSWGRTAKHNLRVGGMPNSKHLKWLAVDVKIENFKNLREFFLDIKRAGLTFLDEGDHYHIQVKRNYVHHTSKKI